jgi:hypothetical protein
MVSRPGGTKGHPAREVACVAAGRGLRSLLTPAVFVIGPIVCGEPIKTRWGPTLEPCGAAGPPPFLAKGPSGDPNIRAAGPHFNDGFPKSVPHGTGGGQFFFHSLFQKPFVISKYQFPLNCFAALCQTRAGLRSCVSGEFLLKKDVDSCAAEANISQSMSRPIRPNLSVGLRMAARKTADGLMSPASPTCQIAPTRLRRYSFPKTPGSARTTGVRAIE